MPNTLNTPITLVTGESAQFYQGGPSQVEIAGTFGTIELTSSSGLVVERTITAAETFLSDMNDMKFTLTIGDGPVTIGVFGINGSPVKIP